VLLSELEVVRDIVPKQRGKVMPRLSLALSTIVLLLFGATATTQAGDFGTADEARSMLNRAVAAVKRDEAQALAMFNSGQGGFKDRDLYVLSTSASDGTITASPSSNGKNLKDFAAGRKVMENAAAGKLGEVTYWVAPVLIQSSLLKSTRSIRK
jgi:hypothetical protein